MKPRWYYSRNGERTGPATGDEIAKLVERCDAEPVLIWTEGAEPGGGLGSPGLAEAADSSAEHSAEAERKPPQSKRAALARGLRNELIDYMIIAGYLAVCFGALLFFKAAILESEGVEATRVGLALVKALILGKFVLILEKLKIGDGKKPAALAFDVLKKALLFTLLLLVLTAAEDVIVGYLHGEEPRDALKGLGGGTRPEALATALLMFLILIPYFAYRDVVAALSRDEFRNLFFRRVQARKEA